MSTTAEPGFLSIVIPTRNRAVLLRDCIRSLIQQDCAADRYEIVVVDDGSTDSTPSVVKDLHPLYPRHTLRYVRSPRRGLNVARNEGLRIAIGDPVVLVDDDILAPPSWLDAVVAGFARYPMAGCLGGPVRLLLEGPQPRLCPRDRLGESELDCGVVEGVTGTVIGANMILPRNAISQIGEFDERLSGAGDESEWIMRLRKSRGDIVYLPQAWVWHRRSRRDLRLHRLLKARFNRGRELIVFAKVTGQHLSFIKELSRMPRFIAHVYLVGDERTVSLNS